jgi:dTDP-4-amino-4,6-dideoxygalactose transaminase
MKQTKIFEPECRYFRPLISQFPSCRRLTSAKSFNLPIAESVTKQVICLPIYPELSFEVIEFISRYINDFQNN